jgi:peroxiredoxin
MSLINQKTESAIIRQMTAARLKQLDLVGKPAPPISGTDLDGKAVKLADYKGQVVVVAFWASWSLPAAEEIEFFEDFYRKNQKRGLKVIAINVDAMQEGGVEVATVLPAVRRFTLAKNVDWPVLMNQPGEANYAAVYGVSEVPASVVIDKKGNVAHLDLHRTNLESKVLEELAR